MIVVNQHMPIRNKKNTGQNSSWMNSNIVKWTTQKDKLKKTAWKNKNEEQIKDCRK